MIDHVDLLREQLKILSGEVALQTSVLKRLTEEAGRSPQSENIQVLPYLNVHCVLLRPFQDFNLLPFGIEDGNEEDQ
jgi:hypothetical protein